MNPEIQIFRAGRHTAANGLVVDIGADALAAASAAYDPARSEAPVVVGHPETNAPAYGWVKSVIARGSALFAELTQVDPAFADLVRAGRYKKISASFYTPQSPDNPKPGSWYLRHVGFLGAAAPAIKGLKAVAFSSSAEGVAEFNGIVIPAPEPESLPPLNVGAPLAAPKPETSDKDATMLTPEELKAQADALAAQKAALDKEKAEFAERQAKDKEDADKARTAEFSEREKKIQEGERLLAAKQNADFVEGLAKEGKILPASKAFLSSFISILPASGVVEFSEAGGKPVSTPVIDGFKSWLSSLPVIVDFSERSKAAGEPGEMGEADAIAKNIVALVHK